MPQIYMGKAKRLKNSIFGKNVFLLPSGETGGECIDEQIATWFIPERYHIQSNIDSVKFTTWKTWGKISAQILYTCIGQE